MNQELSLFENYALAGNISTKLRQRGYFISNSSGVREFETVRDDVIGILRQQEEKPVYLFGFEFKRKRRAIHLGNLWIDNPRRGATLDNWVLEVQGDRYRFEMSELMEEITSLTGRNCKINVLEEEKLERYSSDYD